MGWLESKPASNREISGWLAGPLAGWLAVPLA